MLRHLEQHINPHLSVVTHELTVDTHTLLPLPYIMLWRKYDAHVA